MGASLRVRIASHHERAVGQSRGKGALEPLQRAHLNSSPQDSSDPNPLNQGNIRLLGAFSVGRKYNITWFRPHSKPGKGHGRAGCHGWGLPVPAQKHRQLFNSVQESFSEVWPDSDVGSILKVQVSRGPLWTSQGQGLEQFWVSEHMGYLDDSDQAGTSTVFYTPLAAQLCNKFHNKCQMFSQSSVIYPFQSCNSSWGVMAGTYFVASWSEV